MNKPKAANGIAKSQAYLTFSRAHTMHVSLWWVLSVFLVTGLLIGGLTLALDGRRAMVELRHSVRQWINVHTTLHTITAMDIDAYIQRQELPVVHVAATPEPATGPLRVLVANPRYFTDGSGRAVYLTGSHTWLNLQDGVLTDPPPAFDYTKWLDFVQAHHHNFFRLWIWEQTKWSVEWSAPYYIMPMPYLRTGPGKALDGKAKFDLTQFDQTYFDRMRQRVMEAGQRGMYVSIMLFDGWSVAYPKGPYQLANPWDGHPFNGNNNINAIDGDRNGDDSGTEINELADPAITALQELYIRKVIGTVNDLDNVLYEISNESHADSKLWQYHLIDYIHTYEASKPKQHPVGMTVIWPDGNNDDLFNSNAEWISPNGSLADPPAADGRKVVIADTDHLCGICGDRGWVWKSFVRGQNPLFMDQYDDSYKLDGGGYDLNNANDVSLRKNLGYTRIFADRLNLAVMTPHGELSSSQYCLANPAPTDAAYLVYSPNGGKVTIDLSATPSELQVEWFNPETGATTAGGVVDGGASRSFTAPFAGDAVLYLYQKPVTPTFRLYLPVAGQGSVSAVPAGPFTAGQPVTLSAVPAPGWAFAAWKGDVAGLTTPLALTMTQDMTITALFVPMTVPTYTVTLRIVGQGAVALTAAGAFTQGQTMQITALPDPSWTFTGWSGNLSGPLHSLMTTITNPLHITATFATNQAFIPTVVSDSTAEHQ